MYSHNPFERNLAVVDSILPDKAPVHSHHLHSQITVQCEAIQALANSKQAQKRPKVFGCAQIISLLNIEQNCGLVDLNLASNSDLTCFTSSSVISVVEALMYTLMSMLYVAS
jgi:hypothetical protein